MLEAFFEMTRSRARIIDKLISEIPRRCDLRVIYYLDEDIESKQFHTQVGLVYPHEHVYDYPTDSPSPRAIGHRARHGSGRAPSPVEFLWPR
ncbi:hypothetical protein WSS_A20254 [Rhodococcus opacus M213]|uniref:Uncharacterized protein n=1 Tax=Rhodococcus opacus M213 TaxID=1129896 RepID=K8XJ30_RHOOP|nr:hypothetical protein WSS_A20254 [Rhodococcus opacus M213]